MNIYVSNLSIRTTKDDLKQAFAVFGEVTHIVIVSNERPNRPDTGLYGYVEMATKSQGVAAISNLNGARLGGRLIAAIEALPLSNKKADTQLPKPRGRSRARTM
jgi:RNA recognition motif-containing protein